MLLFITLSVLLCSCVEHRYYVSPFNGNQSTYHPIPLKSDSVKSGYYATAGVAVGGANDQAVDAVLAFHGSVSGGHNLGPLQAFYSLAATAGTYKVDSANHVSNPGNKSFSGTGFEGGLNAVIPLHDGEWRIVGIETSVWNEHGTYLQFRKALPDSAADLVVKKKQFGTLGGYTEIIKKGYNVTIGFRLGAGTVLDRSYYFYDPYGEPPKQRIKYNYFYFTTHLTHKRYTGFIRLNAATKASNALFGLAYRFY